MKVKTDHHSFSSCIEEKGVMRHGARRKKRLTSASKGGDPVRNSYLNVNIVNFALGKYARKKG